MPNRYEVNENPLLFIDNHCGNNKPNGGGYISYRMVICHSIFKLMHPENNKQAKTKEQIAEYLNSLRNFEVQDVDQRDFFETHIVKSKGQSNPDIVVVIDNNNGCYPLVLYSDDAQGRDQRILAFKESVDNIHTAFDQIYNILEHAPRFGTNLYQPLNDFFKFDT